MRVEANAKVNLSLEVYGRRADGYHELRSVVMPIELADIIEIEPSADGSIRSDTGYGERDLAVRAAHALRVACADAP
ncbi:MAG: 4-(cytidine 5'-diphospho)-2-C-methyl-D-erythritol kinase, partial [Kiritimatiellae bacterium]|nr:4-(cytidine 5'-diphospho)-2-C-methyl-D-erythritol kinase [Kiritimatiellia bacterium]